VRALPLAAGTSTLADTKVATILGIFPLFFFFWGIPLFKTTEGVVVGFTFLHGLNSGKKVKFGPPSPGPLRAIFMFFRLFFENNRRRLVRVLKLYRGFILTKKGDFNPPKMLKVVLGFRNFVYEF
jgi:hypothetical protein